MPEEFKFEWWSFAYSNIDVTIKKLMQFSLYDIFFEPAFVPVAPYEGVYFITNLWTMSIEFFGSLVIYGYLLITNHTKKKIFFYIASLLFFILFQSYYMYFLVGMIFAEIYLLKLHAPTKNISKPYLKNIITYYPYVFDILALLIIFNPKEIIHRTLYPICLVFFVLNSHYVRKFFENTISKYLGKISFSTYLVHIPIIISFTSYMLLEHISWSIKNKLIFIGIPSIIFSLIFANLFYFIDKYSIIFSKKVSDFFINNENNRP